MSRAVVMTLPVAVGVRSGGAWGARYGREGVAPFPEGAHWRWTLGEPGARPGRHQRAIGGAGWPELAEQLQFPGAGLVEQGGCRRRPNTEYLTTAEIWTPPTG